MLRAPHRIAGARGDAFPHAPDNDSAGEESQGRADYWPRLQNCGHRQARQQRHQEAAAQDVQTRDKSDCKPDRSLRRMVGPVRRVDLIAERGEGIRPVGRVAHN